MELIHFIADNSSTNYKCEMFMINDRVKLDFGTTIVDKTLVSKGFLILNEYNFSTQGNYEEYKYIYYSDGLELVLTKDKNDVYIEPVEPTPTPEPTEEEIEEKKKTELESVKASKIDELTEACKTAIETGVEIDGKRYSYKLEDQSNISKAMDTAQKAGMNVPYHPNDGSCDLYSYDELYMIDIQGTMNQTINQTYLNQFKLYIKSIEDTSEIDNIKAIKYGDELTGEYLDKYNEIIAQGHKIMEKLIAIETSNVTE